MSLSPAVARLIEALARDDAEAYLREWALQESAADDARSNPVLPATDEAA